MNENTHKQAHTCPAQTPAQMFWIGMAALVVPTLTILGMIYAAVSGAHTSPDVQRATAERLQKVGAVALTVSTADRPLAAGAEVYKAQCTACHAAGVSGAPKSGNAADWAPRIAKGYDTLLTHALKGLNAMPPQGGGTFSDLEIGRAVAYMANAAGGQFEEPAAANASGAAEPAAETAAPSPAAEAAPATQSAAAPATEADPAVGKALYDKSCALCHATGVAGAPSFGDKAAWAPRIATGMDAMLQVTISGKGAMPPRGASTATDDELRAAVQYMVEHAQ